MPHSVNQTGAGPAGPEILLCLEKQRLLEVFSQAVHEAMTLQQQQVTDLVNDADFSRFDALLLLANEKKVQAKQAYLQHVDEHGC